MGLADRVAQLEGRVASLENRVGSVEQTIANHLNNFSGYKAKSEQELADIIGQSKPMVATLEGLVRAGESSADVESAKAMLRRARNNLTRAQNAAQRIS
jgi:hypothetical protein